MFWPIYCSLACMYITIVKSERERESLSDQRLVYYILRAGTTVHIISNFTFYLCCSFLSMSRSVDGRSIEWASLNAICCFVLLIWINKATATTSLFCEFQPFLDRYNSNAKENYCGKSIDCSTNKCYFHLSALCSHSGIHQWRQERMIILNSSRSRYTSPATRFVFDRSNYNDGNPLSVLRLLQHDIALVFTAIQFLGAN